jgi:gentisate 1,2-dioxygenase
MLYSFDQTLEALHALRDSEGSPYEGVALEYTNPQTGGPVTPTISCGIQMVRRGEKLKARRVTGSSVFLVVRDSGRTVNDGKPFDWSKGRHHRAVFVGAARASEYGHEDAILFSISDRPVIQALGLCPRIPGHVSGELRSQVEPGQCRERVMRAASMFRHLAPI